MKPETTALGLWGQGIKILLLGYLLSGWKSCLISLSLEKMASFLMAVKHRRTSQSQLSK